jgi:hypothetical protein
MSKAQMQTVEINGIKMEIDLRTAKRVDTFKVGDRVKLLKKESDNSAPSIHHGVIVGFENFNVAPTIVVAYVEGSYNPELKLAYLNALSNENSTKFEIIPDVDETLPFHKADVLAAFDKEVAKKLEEIRDQLRKKRYFISRFGQMFGETKAEIGAQLEAERESEKQLMDSVKNESEQSV